MVGVGRLTLRCVGARPTMQLSPSRRVCAVGNSLTLQLRGGACLCWCSLTFCAHHVGTFMVPKCNECHICHTYNRSHATNTAHSSHNTRVAKSVLPPGDYMAGLHAATAGTA